MTTSLWDMTGVKTVWQWLYCILSFEGFYRKKQKTQWGSQPRGRSWLYCRSQDMFWSYYNQQCLEATLWLYWLLDKQNLYFDYSLQKDCSSCNERKKNPPHSNKEACQNWKRWFRPSNRHWFCLVKKNSLKKQCIKLWDKWCI